VHRWAAARLTGQDGPVGELQGKGAARRQRVNANLRQLMEVFSTRCRKL
jgi:hypothetical protein